MELLDTQGTLSPKNLALRLLAIAGMALAHSVDRVLLTTQGRKFHSLVQRTT